MAADKKFVMVKYPNKNLVLRTTGGYSNDAEKKVIQSAGWIKDETNLPILSEEILAKSPHLETELFYAPAGTAIFGMHTEKEARAHKYALKQAFKNAGITLYVRKGNLRELL